MRVRPADLDDTQLGRFLAGTWGPRLVDLAYAPVGYGSHHWIATTDTGTRRFVTVDALGPGRRLADLRAAIGSAAALRDAGVRFVVAPLPARTGELVVPFGETYAVAVLPYVDARPWPSGEHSAVLELLVAVHGAPSHAVPAARDDLAIEARDDLEEALQGLGQPWTAGPYSARCRDLLATQAPQVDRRLAAYDDLVTACRARDEPVVLTHGEPKPDNLLVTDAGPVLVDWDTALLAPPARDLWWLAADVPDLVGRYAALTGRALHPDDLALYALRWDLTDLALFVRDLRAPHVADADTAVAWAAVQRIIRGHPG